MLHLNYTHNLNNFNRNKNRYNLIIGIHLDIHIKISISVIYKLFILNFEHQYIKHIHNMKLKENLM